MLGRYLVTHLMGADLNNIVKCQKLTDDHVQFLIYQILRGLKVSFVFFCKVSQHLSEICIFVSYLQEIFVPTLIFADISACL